jgi:alkylation response protein AidB-like acyl-CoA dehydrogenase
MSFVLNEDEQMLRDSARAFLGESSPVTALAPARREKPDRLLRELWSSLAEMGWCGVLVSEDHGGVDMGYAAAGVLEEMGRTLTSSPFLSTSVLGATAFNLAGYGRAEIHWLPKIAAVKSSLRSHWTSGRATSPTRSRHARSQRRERLSVLSGRQALRECGAGADLLIVAARTDDDKIGLFLVDPKADGVSRTDRRTLDSHVPGRFPV